MANEAKETNLTTEITSLSDGTLPEKVVPSDGAQGSQALAKRSPPPQTEAEVLASGDAFEVIRTETVLSKFPIHQLAKKGRLGIAINRKGKNGETLVRWKVSPHQEFGAPGPTAYKIDTLVINRHIEEAGRPLPKYIKIGSLRDIAKALGIAANTTALKQALLQNAFAAITAHFSYLAADGRKHTLEAAFTRYSVVFTGEALPDGTQADAVYIIPNEPYRDILNRAPVRPLNYEYLKALAPAAQRFYEIISYRLFAAFQHKHSQAAITYSDYCLLSGQVRSWDWNFVRAQMYRVHKPHLASKYLAQVAFHPQPDDDDQPDWLMLYTAGPKAKAEYTRFTKQRQHSAELAPAPARQVADKAPQQPSATRRAKTRSRQAASVATSPPASEPSAASAGAKCTPTPELLDLLVAQGITRRGACALLCDLPASQAPQLPAQLEYGAHLIATARTPIQNPAGFLISLVRDNLAVPADFVTQSERSQQAEAERGRELAAQHQAEVQYYYELYQEECAQRYLAALPPAERQNLYAFEEAVLQQQYPAIKSWREETLAAFAEKRLMTQLPLLDYETFAREREANSGSPR